jgi:hypothetical protein
VVGEVLMATGSPQLAIQVLNEIAKLLTKLDETQLADLVEGRAVVEFRTPEVTVASRAVKKAPATKAPKPELDLDEVIREIRSITEEYAVEAYLLKRDREISAELMKELAKKIGPPVSSRGTKAQLRKNIAAGTAGLLDRPASVFSGSWDR